MAGAIVLQKEMGHVFARNMCILYGGYERILIAQTSQESITFFPDSFQIRGRRRFPAFRGVERVCTVARLASDRENVQGG